MKYIVLLIVIIASSKLYCQSFPSNSISADSSIINNWAIDATIIRGKQNISNPESPNAEFGNPLDASGAADNSPVSLGDAGIAILTFEKPIKNGEGADFCVFENSFTDTFLELAFVEVSTDGERFVRFASISNTQTDEQVSTFGLLEPSDLYNLAGKYKALFGTPFDLEELKDSAGIDINNINFVRIVDVVGSIEDDYANFDSRGNKVNDPFPTEFPSGGFDLDAVGVIHEAEVNSINDKNTAEIIKISRNSIILENTDYKYLSLIDLSGQLLFKQKIELNTIISISIDNYISGAYIIELVGDKERKIKKIVKLS